MNTRSEQARLNGAKSKGPITIDGKSRSSQNAIKHGFAASVNVVISIEEKPEWDLHLEGCRASFKPQCYVEQTMVDQLASISWRQSRLVALETALIDAQISVQRDNVCNLHPISAEDPYFHFVLAWQGLARQPQKPSTTPDSTVPPDGLDINSIELLRRYLVTLDRQYRNVLSNLRQYRKDFAPPPNPQPKEPDVPKTDLPKHVENAAPPIVPTHSWGKLQLAAGFSRPSLSRHIRRTQDRP
jgi:hypothetical protein